MTPNGLPQQQQHPPPSPATDLRTRVVEILSTVANGCLSELGYYPGLREELARARSDNGKLYADNRALAQQVALLTDRCALLAGTHGQPDQLAQLDELRRTVRDLREERGALQALVDHHSAAHDAIRRTAARTEDKFARLYQMAVTAGIIPDGRTHPAQHPAGAGGHAPGQQIVGPVQVHPNMLARPPSQTGLTSQAARSSAQSSAQHTRRSSQSSSQTPRVPSQSSSTSQTLRVPSQSSTSHSTKASQPGSSSQHFQSTSTSQTHKVLSLSSISHTPRVPSQSSSTSQTPRVPSQSNISQPAKPPQPGSSSQHTKQPPPPLRFLSNNTLQVPPQTPPDSRVSRRVSYPSTSTELGPHSQHTQHTSRPAGMAPPPARPLSASASATTFPRMGPAPVSLPTAPAGLLAPLGMETFALPPRRREVRPAGWAPPNASGSQDVIDLTSDDEGRGVQTQTLQPSAAAGSAAEGSGAASPASSADVPLSAVHAPPLSPSRVQALQGASPASSASSSADVPLSAVHARRVSVHDEPPLSPASSADVPLSASLPLPQPVHAMAVSPVEDALKRVRTLSMEPHAASPKRARFADPPASTEPTLPDAEMEMEMGAGMDVDAEIEPPANTVLDGEAGEALTSEEDCAESMFAEDDDQPGHFTCTLCELRFEEGLSDAPEVYVHPRMDVLIAHCKEEHPTVWDSLRHTRPSDDDVDSAAGSPEA
ncbi:hypothetical protein HWV62_682 [Athelia sp. TMB]|nr:hypothetical protein HWV62_682 [Athelia sp. TMB]